MVQVYISEDVLKSGRVWASIFASGQFRHHGHNIVFRSLLALAEALGQQHDALKLAESVGQQQVSRKRHRSSAEL